MQLTKSLILAFLSATSLASAYTSHYNQYARRSASPSYYDDDLDLDLHARDLDELDLHARDLDDFELSTRDLDDLYAVYRRDLTPQKTNKVLGLVQQNQRTESANARQRGDFQAMGTAARIAQNIGIVRGQSSVAADRAPPSSAAEARSRQYNRAWGDDHRGGHRGGGAPGNMRTGS